MAQHLAGQIFSVEKVGDELKAGDDQLVAWAKLRGEQFFLKPDAKLMTALGVVATWASKQHYSQAAVQALMRAADLFLVAHALAHKYVVVTQEKHAPAAIHSIKIPTICLALDVECVDTFQLLRREQARFVLG